MNMVQELKFPAPTWADPVSKSGVAQLDVLDMIEPGEKSSARIYSFYVVADTVYQGYAHRWNPVARRVLHIDWVSSEGMEHATDLQLAENFQKCAQEWRAERGATSSVSRMTESFAYRRIIAMGPGVIPIILRQLEMEGDRPDHWFAALDALTQGEDPVPEEARGNMKQMARAWIRWGRERYGR